MRSSEASHGGRVRPAFRKEKLHLGKTYQGSTPQAKVLDPGHVPDGRLLFSQRIVFVSSIFIILFFQDS